MIETASNASEVQQHRAEEPFFVAPLPFEPLPGFTNPLTDDAALADCRGKRIGILIVTYNAVTTLTKVLKRITPNVWRNVEEIAVFDDASKDSTYELAMGLKALRDLPKLSVLSNPKNLGYGGNQKAGYKYFIEKGFDVVVLLHGDGQYAPEILSHVYSPLVKGEADAVFGSRMMKTYGGPLKGGMPMYKYLGNRILTIFENAALGLNLTEFHSGYRAYNLHALEKIDFSEMTNDFHFDTEIIIKLHHQHFRITEVPIPTYYGDEICYVNGVRYAKDVFRAVHRYKQTCRSVTAYPEFKEYFVTYPVKQSKYSTHSYLQRSVGKNDSVLDIGCGDGRVAAELKRDGTHYICGIDTVSEPARQDALDEYYCVDLDRQGAQTVAEFGARRFNTILLLDILEHLKDAGPILDACHSALESNGQVLVSMPNIANLYVRLLLLFGSFSYSDRGPLDRSHLRFYTRKTARQLLESHGYRIVDERPTVVPLELVIGLAPENLLMKALNRVMAALSFLRPPLFAYQFFFVLRSERNEAPARS